MRKMMTKLHKKNGLVRLVLLYFLLFSLVEGLSAQRLGCGWEPVGEHHQTPLQMVLRRDLSGRGQNFFNISSALIAHSGNIYLQIYIEIDDLTSGEFLGAVEAGAALDFLPTRAGSNITIYCPRGAKPNIIGDKTTYNIIYLLDKQAIARLSKTEVGALGLYWSGSKQEYKLYDVDFFSRLLPCIESRPR